VTFREGLAVLDEELARLPEPYRAVLFVCCLEGRARDEAAAQLGWSEGQLKGRLERAREMLRARLSRRGVELGGVLLAAGIAGSASAAVVLAEKAVSPAVLALTSGVIHAMRVQKLKAVGALLMLAAVTGAVAYCTASGRAEDGPVPRKSEHPPMRIEPEMKPASVKRPPEAKWGEAVEGMQCRLRVDREIWGASAWPEFTADVRYTSDRPAERSGPSGSGTRRTISRSRSTGSGSTVRTEAWRYPPPRSRRVGSR
jgi:hypothetical protein